MAKKKEKKEVVEKLAPDYSNTMVADAIAEVVPVKVVEEKFKGLSVSVYSSKGDFIRTYSSKEHGDNFHDLATGFAKKVKGKLG